MIHFAFDDQINSQHEAVKSVLDTIDVPQLDSKRPVIFAGIGASLHACKVAAYWASELARRRGSNPDTTRSDVEPYKSAIDRVRL